MNEPFPATPADHESHEEKPQSIGFEHPAFWRPMAWLRPYRMTDHRQVSQQ